MFRAPSPFLLALALLLASGCRGTGETTVDGDINDKADAGTERTTRGRNIRTRTKISRTKRRKTRTSKTWTRKISRT